MKLFQREQRSLFGEILDWMLTPLLLLWPVSLVLTWFVAQSAAGKPFDRALEYNVGELASLVTVRSHQLEFLLPLPAHKLLRAAESDTVFYQVLGARGEFLSGERNLPLPPAGEKPFFSEVRLRDEEVDQIHNNLFRALLTYMLEDPRNITPCMHLLFIAKNVERMGDHTTSIAEQVQFLVSGEMPEDDRPKGDTTSTTFVEAEAG